MHWTIALTLGAIAGILSDIILSRATNIICGKGKHAKIKNAEIHHSVIGILLITISIAKPSLFLLSTGISMILSHSFREGSFLFIETGKKKIF